ncbi:twin-arginine translocase subunit TatC [Euryhalocaulis caribicus]|uniref:twin-arginine translocase subunit TatC n=1 Tax=Euryhalocaulis caribicus TaxID=1161401 RepID=UPI0003A2A35E|nr:twin-arginine translocase subunit TatC [Euryhalocaulis caribicus]
MSGSQTPPPDITDKDDSPDEVESSRAPLLEHLTELRSRLIFSSLVILAAFIVCFIFAGPIYKLLLVPFQNAAERYNDGQGRELQLVFTAPLEFFLVKVKLALVGAVVVAFPVVAWQLYAFVAPGLYKNERGALLPFLGAMPVLFAIGAAMVFYVVLPLVMNFALRQQIMEEGIVSVSLLPKVSDYFSLVTALLFAFGAAFQLPVVLTLLAKAGFVTSTGLRKFWRYAVVVTFVLSAFVTPPDIISQTVLAIPILLLYEISIWCVKLIERRREKDAD